MIIIIIILSRSSISIHLISLELVKEQSNLIESCSINCIIYTWMQNESWVWRNWTSSAIYRSSVALKLPWILVVDAASLPIGMLFSRLLCKLNPKPIACNLYKSMTTDHWAIRPQLGFSINSICNWQLVITWIAILLILTVPLLLLLSLLLSENVSDEMSPVCHWMDAIWKLNYD